MMGVAADVTLKHEVDGIGIMWRSVACLYWKHESGERGRNARPREGFQRGNIFFRQALDLMHGG